MCPSVCDVLSAGAVACGGVRGALRRPRVRPQAAVRRPPRGGRAEERTQMDGEGDWRKTSLVSELGDGK